MNIYRREYCNECRALFATGWYDPLLNAVNQLAVNAHVGIFLAAVTAIRSPDMSKGNKRPKKEVKKPKQDKKK